MDLKTRNTFKKMLDEQLQTLLKEASDTIEGLTTTTEQEPLPDITDQASQEIDQNFLLRIRQRERGLILKIREALRRIERGEFGICESCGGKISVARLKARPVTTLCIDCKKEAEEKEKQ